MARPSKDPEEFRREAVRLALSTDDSRAGVARRIGVNETSLRNWVNTYRAEEARGSDPLALAMSERDELRRSTMRCVRRRPVSRNDGDS